MFRRHPSFAAVGLLAASVISLSSVLATTSDGPDRELPREELSAKVDGDFDHDGAKETQPLPLHVDGIAKRTLGGNGFHDVNQAGQSDAGDVVDDVNADVEDPANCPRDPLIPPIR